MCDIGVTSLFSPIRQLAKRADVWLLYSVIDDRGSNCYNEGTTYEFYQKRFCNKGKQ